MNDDFYIGYRDRSQPGLARHVRRMVWLIAFAVLGVSSWVASKQSVAEPGVFEYGVVRTFEGVLVEAPLPLLQTVAANGARTNYLLVGEGKHGLPEFARGASGQRVRLEGTLIQMGAYTMIEVHNERAFQRLGPSTTESTLQVHRRAEVVLTGEVVDTKCYFGVMRPAAGKVHRGCAVRCLSGGVPPGLLVRDNQGGALVLMLVGSRGKPLELDPQWAAREVKVRGQLVEIEGIQQLEVVSAVLARTSPEQ